MSKLPINFVTLFNAVLFTLGYIWLYVFLVSKMSGIILLVVFSVVALVIYINILRLFLLETFFLEETRVTEFLIYILMYAITISVIVLPFILEPIVVIEAPIIRYVIIGFASIMLLKYTLFMALGPWYDLKSKFLHKLNFDHKDYNPLVSVIIPAWNEGIGIIDTVKSVLKSSYKNLEIVVVNDGSTDDSDQRIRDFLKQYEKETGVQTKIKYFYQGNTGKGGALNKAIALSEGEIIVSVDADCVVDKNAVREFVKVFKNPEVKAAVGNVKIGNKNNAVGIIQYLEFLFSFYFKRVDALLGSIYIIGGAAGAFRREIFEKLGGYSTDNITEDIELTVRIQDHGLRIEYANEAVVYTEGASDLNSLKKQRLRWKRGRFQTFYQYIHMFFSGDKKHNKILSWIIMPLAVLQELHLLLEIPFLIFLYVFSILNSDFSSFLAGVVVVGFMFVVQILFYEKNARRLSFVLLAPIGWLLFYVATYVEVWALLKSIESFVLKKEVIWQKWNRKGIGIEGL